MFQGISESTISTRMFGLKYVAARTIASPLFIYAALTDNAILSSFFDRGHIQNPAIWRTINTA